MARGGGVFWKGISLFLRAIELCCALAILGIFSYFLAVLARHGLHVDISIRAIEGISGAAAAYTVFGLTLVCCLGGITFLSVIAMLLDLAFIGAFIYIAWATRGGARSCTGYVITPLGSGDAYTRPRVSTVAGSFVLPYLRTACRLETTTFAFAIIGIVFFFFSILVELALIRHHKKEKAFGPSPNNGYTAGTPRRKFWQRKSKNRDAELAAAEKPDALPAHQTPADFRTSYATESTAVGGEPVYNKYGNTSMVGGTGAAAPQNVATTHGYQTTTTTHAPAGGYTPYRSENTTGTF